MTTTKNRTKILLAAAAVAATAFVAATSCYMLLPSGYISLDINPSIEIHTNRLNNVTSISGVNADAQKLLEGYQLRDRDLDDVVEDLVDRMVLQGYLGQSSDANLLVTVDEGTVNPETLKQVNNRIAEHLEYRRVSANVVGQSIKMDDDLKERASAQNISAGKLSVIDRLISNDPTLRPEDLRDTRVSDLLTAAQEKNISLDLLEDRLDDLDDHFEDDRLDGVADLLENQLDDLDDRDDINDDRDDDDRDDRTQLGASRASTPVASSSRAPVRAPVSNRIDRDDDDDNWNDDDNDDDNWNDDDNDDDNWNDDDNDDDNWNDDDNDDWGDSNDDNDDNDSDDGDDD